MNRRNIENGSTGPDADSDLLGIAGRHPDVPADVVARPSGILIGEGKTRGSSEGEINQPDRVQRIAARLLGWVGATDLNPVSVPIKKTSGGGEGAIADLLQVALGEDSGRRLVLAEFVLSRRQGHQWKHGQQPNGEDKKRQEHLKQGESFSQGCAPGASLETELGKWHGVET